jgi:plastocyanin
MKICTLLLLTSTICQLSHAQTGIVRGNVDVEHEKKKSAGSADAVVWLTAYESHIPLAPGPVAHLLQKNKQFSPHVVTITTGTTVEFPNRDPFFHDVFSIYRGKPFDLGLYESGSSRKVAFTKPGVSYIFCNIHPEMSAVIVALQTPYFAQTDAEGRFEMANIPAGRYKLRVWHELASASELEGLAHDVQINPGENLLPALVLHVSDATPAHTNKYGEAYSRDRNPY